MTPRGLDHIVHAVHDLPAAADLYRRLGFTVGARNQHPWGTQNHVVQMPGFFIELLTMADPGKLGQDTISIHFGRFNQTFLQHRQGFSLLILESRDAEKDAAEFSRNGFGLGSAARFERLGRRPDGSEVTVAFSLAFARDPRAPDCGFAVCQQHFPENFWNPAFQTHRNGVTGVAGAVLVADNPSDHHIFLSALAGQRELQSTSSGIQLTTPRGDIQVMDRSAYRNHFGVAPPDVTEGARLAALRVTAADLAQVRQAVSDASLQLREEHGRLIVGPEDALGATIVFEDAPAG
jgi:hypothetical protein